MHLPLLPLQLMTIHLETYALRLNNVQRFYIVALLKLRVTRSHEVWQEVIRCTWWRNTLGFRKVLEGGWRGGLNGQPIRKVRGIIFSVCNGRWITMRRKVDMNDLQCIGVEDWNKVLVSGGDINELIRTQAK